MRTVFAPVRLPMRRTFPSVSDEQLRNMSFMSVTLRVSMSDMFRNCSSLTDGNVRLIGKRTGVNTVRMIQGSGLTREPFYDSSGQPI